MGINPIHLGTYSSYNPQFTYDVYPGTISVGIVDHNHSAKETSLTGNMGGGGSRSPTNITKDT